MPIPLFVNEIPEKRGIAAWRPYWIGKGGTCSLADETHANREIHPAEAAGMEQRWRSEETANGGTEFSLRCRDAEGTEEAAESQLTRLQIIKTEERFLGPQKNAALEMTYFARCGGKVRKA